MSAAAVTRPRMQRISHEDFFTSLLQGPLLERADRDRGHFRSLLLKALRDFLGHATEKLGAYKRGGGVKLVSWDDWMAEAPSQLSISPQALNSWSAEQLFDLRWAATVVEQALRRLREECQSNSRLRLFETLSLYLTTDRTDVSVSESGYDSWDRRVGGKKTASQFAASLSLAHSRGSRADRRKPERCRRRNSTSVRNAGRGR